MRLPCVVNEPLSGNAFFAKRMAGRKPVPGAWRRCLEPRKGAQSGSSALLSIKG